MTSMHIFCIQYSCESNLDLDVDLLFPGLVVKQEQDIGFDVYVEVPDKNTARMVSEEIKEAVEMNQKHQVEVTCIYKSDEDIIISG